MRPRRLSPTRAILFCPAAGLACLAALAAAILLVGLPASGATITWIAGSGQWDVSGNWSPSGQPQAGDDVNLTQSSATSRTVTYYNTTNPTAVLNSLTIDATGTGTMTLDMPNSHALSVTKEYVGYSGKGAVTQSTGTNNGATLYLGYNPAGNGTYTLTGGTLSSSTQYIGYSGKGVLCIQTGGQVSNGVAYLGQVKYSTGAATVTGAGSKWTNSSGLIVGNYGSGTLNIEAGGQVSNPTAYLGYESGATGAAKVTGTDSKWTNSGSLYVGHYGSGTLNIEAGGLVSNAYGYYGYLGYNSSGTGAAKVTGAGSKWTIVGDLYGGYDGSGTLNIEAGGEVSNTKAYLGYNSGGTGKATVTGTGSKWTNSSSLYVGYKGSGTLNIEAGGQVSNTLAYLGNFSGSTGTAMVSGAGSTWVGSVLNVGFSGNGTLKIQAGGQVSNTSGYLGYNSGSTGTATVTGTGSMWTNSGSFYVGYSGNGTLNIQAGGQVSSALASLGNNSAISSGTATVTGAGSMWTNSISLYVGNNGSGTLNIEAGGQVSSTVCLIGYKSGSTGTATVTGSGSRWTNTSVVFGGDGGSGTLNIEGGGQVSSKSGQVGYAFGSTGRAMVTGADAIWTISDGLSVGVSGSGTLTVADGGKVTAQSVSVNDKSAVTLHVSGNNMLVSGSAATTGSIANNGIVSFYADSFLAADTYTTISEYAGRAMTWSGTGSYRAYGGTWDNAAKTFTVVAATALMAGATETVSTGERLLFADPGSGNRVGASFGSITGDPTFSASPMSQAELDALALVPGFEGLVLSAWDFDTNFTGGDDVLLSFDIGLGAQDPGIWHYKNGVWGQYAADLLTYDGNGNLSFAVTDFSGYAVTAAPEPATLALLAAGAAGALLHRRRRR